MVNPLEQLQMLSSQVSEHPETQLLRFDVKRNSYCFEQKGGFFGAVKRLLFRNKSEYDFDQNLEAIETLFKYVQNLALNPQQTNALRKLESRLEDLIVYVDKKKRRPHEEQIEALRSCLVGDLATEARESNSVKKATESIASFNFEGAFEQYKKAITEEGTTGRGKDRFSVLDKFVEVGLLLKRYDEVLEVVNSIQPPEAQAGVRGARAREQATAEIDAKKAEIEKRITDFRALGDGPKNEFGFTEKEWKMLQDFSITFKQEASGVFKGREEEWRDFFLYATGNMNFNKRLKEARKIEDQNVLAAIEYFATYSFKSIPEKWQDNKVAVDHADLVWQRYQAKRELQENEALYDKLSKERLNPETIKAEGPAFRPGPATTRKEQQWVKQPKGKGKKRGPKHVLQEVEVVVPGAPALSKKAWKGQTYNQAESARVATLPQLQEKIANGKVLVKSIEESLRTLQRDYPDQIVEDPLKLQPKELLILDSLASFRQTLTDDMNKALGLNRQPFFSGVYGLLQTLEGVYDDILIECSAGTGKYKTGDISFVNELKKMRIAPPKKDEAYPDVAGRLLFPFGHTALIDQEGGSISFSQQLLQFDHSELRLQDFLFYDSYRLDFSKLIDRKSRTALREVLSSHEVEDEHGAITTEIRDLKAEADAKGLTEEQFILEEIEELYELSFGEVLEQEKETSEEKFSRIEGGKPSITQFITIDDLLKWVEEANREIEDPTQKIEPQDLLSVEGGTDQEIEKGRQLRAEFLQHLYKGITNNEDAQFKAFAKSWLFVAPLAPIVRLLDPSIDLTKVQVHGEMVCSQFALIITIKALQNLQEKLRERAGGSQVQFLNIPKVGELEYGAATTEFMLKKLKNQLTPVQAPGILSEIIEVNPSYLRPIPIDSTLVYMAKKLFGAYEY